MTGAVQCIHADKIPSRFAVSVLDTRRWSRNFDLHPHRWRLGRLSFGFMHRSSGRRAIPFSVFVVDVLLRSAVGVSLRRRAFIHIGVVVRLVANRRRLAVVAHVWAWLTIVSSDADNLILGLTVVVVVNGWWWPARIVVAVVPGWGEVVSTVLNGHVTARFGSSWCVEVLGRCMVDAVFA